MGQSIEEVLAVGSERVAEVVQSPVVQSLVKSQLVQEVVQSPQLKQMVHSPRLGRMVQATTDLVTDPRLWYFIGGLSVGAYFGYRTGIVSGRARSHVQSIKWMKGAGISSYSGVKGITVQTLEVPVIAHPSEVLIEVKAASIDPVDIKVSQGYGRGMRELVNKYSPNADATSFPVILGRDGTGVVQEVGGDVTNLRPGDRVWFVVPHCFQGSLSNFISLDRDYIRPLPPSLSYEAGATLPYSGITVWDILVTSGGLGPYESSKGKSVFIWGGVRAVERLAVQLCHVWGCEVTCTAPLYTHDYLLSLGATSAIKDDMSEVHKLIRSGTRFDVVVNTAGLIAEDLCLTLARQPEGRVVTTLTQPSSLPEYGLFTNIMAGTFNMIADIFKANLLGGERTWIQTRLRGDILDYLAEMIDKGRIAPVGERIFNLEQVELAFKCLAGGGHKGKIVVRLDSLDNYNHQLALK